MTTKSIQPLVVFGVLIILSGCVTPYKTPLLDPADATFPGIHGLLNDDQAVNVLSIHGMCTHSKPWVEKTVARIRENLPALSAETPQPVSIPGVELYETQFLDRDGTVQLRNYALVWSPLTAEGKKSLCYDSGNVTPSCADSTVLSKRKRGFINQAVKSTLMNDCLSDVVLYLGPDGAHIRKAFRATIDKIAERNADAAPIVLISESLGSKILADSMLEEADGREGRFAFLRSTRQVFMAANQLPLIELSEESWKRAGGSSWSSFLGEVLEPQAEGSVLAQVVAFTDPNDLLSYELRDRTYSSANAIVSNDSTWFWALERPDTAHTGYLDNDEVWKLIVCGPSGECPAFDTPP